MATEAGRTDHDDGKRSRNIPSWVIIVLVAVVLIGAFWLFDLSGADPAGDDLGEETDQGTEDGSSDLDFGEPADGEGPEIDSEP